LIKEKRLQVVPHLGVCPVFAEDISRVKDTINVVHLNEFGSNGFSHMMEGQGIMALV
jgi:hypothetical protein